MYIDKVYFLQENVSYRSQACRVSRVTPRWSTVVQAGRHRDLEIHNDLREQCRDDRQVVRLGRIKRWLDCRILSLNMPSAPGRPP